MSGIMKGNVKHATPSRDGRQDGGGTPGVAPASSRHSCCGHQDGCGVSDDVIRTRDRGYLPHWERHDAAYFVTFRLADTLPQQVLAMLEAEREEAEAAIRKRGDELSSDEKAEIARLFSRKVDGYLDAGEGKCWLRDGRIAELVIDALRHFDGDRYRLHAWCVMPNHVHVVFSVPPGMAQASSRRDSTSPSRGAARMAALPPDVAPPSRWPSRDGRQDGGATPRVTPLASILHSWKSFTANQANGLLGRKGAFWEREYYDHLIRDERDFWRCVMYTVENPVKARLCRSRKEWPWTGVANLKAMRRG